MNKFLYPAVLLLFSIVASHTCTAQSYISPQVGYGSKTFIVNISAGADFNWCTAEAELKFGTSHKANTPAFMGAGAGPFIRISDCASITVLAQAYYMYVSADYKYKNGFRAGACLRLQYKKITIAGSYVNHQWFAAAGVKMYLRIS
ncbi:MAG TPA: hypothetical protein PL045_09650 [Chitinophagaceae bacterium]|nr:hypothetical protein [Chitinophagaceae bacterium]